MSIIFISHKLNEVLEIADRITVLRRGKKIDTVPREGATEAGLARMMVGREVLLRVEKPPAQPGRRAARGRRPRTCSDDRGLAGGARRLVRGARRRDRRHRRRRRQRPERADRGDHRPAAGARAATIVVGGREDRARRAPREMLDAGVGHIPEDRQRRGLVLEFTIAENIALHDYAEPPASRWGWLFPRRLIERAREPDRGVRRARRRAATRGGGALGRQPAEGRRRARDRARPEGARSRRSRRAASTSARSSTCTAASSRSATRAARSCSSRSSSRRCSRSPTASSSSTRARSSASTRADATEEEIGLEMLGGRRKEAAA